MAEVAGTVNVPGKLSDILGQSVPLGSDPIVLFALSEPSVAADGSLVTSVERRVQVGADGKFIAKLVPTMTMRPYAFYRIAIGIRDASLEYRVIDFPQFRLHVPPEGGNFSDLVHAPPPPQVIANGYGPPPSWFSDIFYVDVSGEDPELYGPPNGVI